MNRIKEEFSRQKGHLSLGKCSFCICKEVRKTAKKNIGAYITLDGEKEFRSATSACNKSVAALKSEMKLVEAQTAGNANTLDTLKKKHDILSRTLDEHVKKEETVKKGLKNSKEQYEKIGNKLAEYKSKLQQAKNALEELQNSSETTEKALKEQKEQVEGLEKIVSKGEETYRRAGNRVSDWKKQLNNAEAQTIRATKALNENDTYLKEAEKSWKGCAKSIDEFGNETDDTVNQITKLGTILKTNLKNTVVDIGKDAFTSTIQGTLELEEAQNRLQASTGATAEEPKAYKEEMQEAYSAGYGESISDIADAMALVKQYTKKTDPSKLKKMAENGMVLEISIHVPARGTTAIFPNFRENIFLNTANLYISFSFSCYTTIISLLFIHFCALFMVRIPIYFYVRFIFAHKSHNKNTVRRNSSINPYMFYFGFILIPQIVKSQTIYFFIYNIR